MFERHEGRTDPKGAPALANPPVGLGSRLRRSPAARVGRKHLKRVATDLLRMMDRVFKRSRDRSVDSHLQASFSTGRLIPHLNKALARASTNAPRRYWCSLM